MQVQNEMAATHELQDQQLTPTINNYKNQDQSNDFEAIPQQIIMRNLTQFFLTATTNSMPYIDYFTKHEKKALYALSYLYSFIKSVYHNKKVCQIFASIFPQINQLNSRRKEINLIKLILNEEHKAANQPVDRKTLLSRYISLPTAIAQYLSSIKANIPTIQNNIIEQVCQNMKFLPVEEKIFISNKIIMLGYTQLLLLEQAKGNGVISQCFSYILRKDKIIISALKIILKIKKGQIDCNIPPLLQILNKSTHFSQKQNKREKNPILSIIQSQYFKPSHAQQIYQIVLQKNIDLQIILLEQLLIWWTEGNDHYLIYNMIKFRTNLLAVILLGFDSSRVMDYSIQISLGIQRRLMNITAQKKQIVNLIWAILSKKLKVQIPAHFNTDLLLDDNKPDQNQNQNQNQNQQQTAIKTQQPEPIQKQQLSQQHHQTAEQNPATNPQTDEMQIRPKPPQNLYDCILGMQNPVRKKITLELLPNMIRNNADDLVFVWRDLLLHLLYELNQDTKGALVALFVTRAQMFIQSVADLFFRKEQALNDKIVMIQVLCQGVQQLSNRPVQTQSVEKQQFYFKKVTSKYYNERDQKLMKEKQIEQKDQNRTRRWGHTKIAHDRKIKQKQSGVVSLKIVKNQPFINRLYQIANQLFFQVISRLVLLPIFPKQPMFATPLLKLLAELSFNLKNHIEKYKVLTQIVDICLHAIQFIEAEGKKQKQEDKLKYTKKWKNTNLSVLNLLNKISLVIDQYIPARMLQNLQKCVVRLKSSKQYGLSPIVDMIEANIYTNVSGQKTNF